jgi:hypothetical protein
MPSILVDVFLETANRGCPGVLLIGASWREVERECGESQRFAFFAVASGARALLRAHGARKIAW